MKVFHKIKWIQLYSNPPLLLYLYFILRLNLCVQMTENEKNNIMDI